MKKPVIQTRGFFIKLLKISIDLATISALFFIFVQLRKLGDHSLPAERYFDLWPFLIIFWIVFEKTGLYEGATIHSGSSLGPTEEIRRTFYAVTTIFIFMGFLNFFYRSNDYLFSRTVFIGTYTCCLFFIPFNRILLRKTLTHLECWGVPAIIIGSGKTAAETFNNLLKHPEYGLMPVGYFTDNNDQSEMPSTATFLGPLNNIPEQAGALKIKYAILAKDTAPDSPFLQEIINRYGILFPHLLFISQNLLNTTSGVLPVDLAGTLGLEIRHNLQIPAIYRSKRMIDYALTLPILFASLPIMAGIAIWIKKDTPGPIFFKHRRVTKNGRQINIYKFRTMTIHAEEQLGVLLKNDPKLEEEWKKFGKLENDPRITKVGNWLRKTSLDELPQLFNVLQGKLTLVGPRPLVQEEIKMYGEAASLFDRVLPGLTDSGRYPGATA